LPSYLVYKISSDSSMLTCSKKIWVDIYI
jgi:hypothetical protein